MATPNNNILDKISWFYNKFLKSHSEMESGGISPYKKDFDDSVLEYFETPQGNYYLPNNAPRDSVINCMKFGKIFEPEVVELAQRYIKNGTIVLDVGNFGQMSLLFSKLAGPEGTIYSFEADDFICDVLKKNIAANNCTNIKPVCKAVYNKNGDVMFYPVQDFKRFDSYGSYGLDPNAKEGREVQTITIDSLNIQEPISFMKVDVQGSDLFVLQGAVETIKRHKMPILFEYEKQFGEEFNAKWQDYCDFIGSISYRIKETILDINYLIVPK
jgi:FkbM family methyltransferase